MTSVHYFPRYSQPENFVTNNSLLLLSRLYEFSRFKFERLLGLLCAANDVDPPDVSLQFSQQVGTSASVVDGYVTQRGLYLAVETKLHEHFSMGQLKRHATIFREGREQQFLLLLGTTENPLSDKQRADLVKAIPRDVTLLCTSFEALIRFGKQCLSDYDEEMLALVADFEAFCSGEKLLSTDQFTLFAPPCSRSYEENISCQLYYCPATWGRRKARYLGIYANKAVRAIGTVGKVVECNVDLEHDAVEILNLDGAPLTGDEKARIVRAARAAAQRNGWDLSTGNKFYLFEQMATTHFEKTSSGGIMGHRYFDLKKVLGGPVPPDLAALALALREKRWE